VATIYSKTGDKNAKTMIPHTSITLQQIKVEQAG
jgi:hypothetical protein